MPYVKGITGAVPEDLAGRRFSRLTVLAKDAERVDRPRWVCQCDCGAIKSAAAYLLKCGKTRSCGCLDADRKRTATIRHGFNRTPTYATWANMLGRCKNPNRPDYKNYGGRGISVCERWLDFRNFLADMGEKPHSMSIDRIDNDGNYEPSNCRWATASEQRRNQRTRCIVRAAAEIQRAREAG